MVVVWVSSGSGEYVGVVGSLMGLVTVIARFGRRLLLCRRGCRGRRL